MIIDTKKIDSFLLKAYSTLFLNDYYVGENDAFNNDVQIFNKTLESYSLIKDDKLVVNFDKCNNFFFDGKCYKITNTENLPNEGDMIETAYLEFNELNNALNYNDVCIYHSKLKKINVQLSENIKRLDIRESELTNFNNFPKSLKSLYLCDNKMKDLIGSPSIDGELSIIGCEELETLEGINGNYHTLYLESLKIEKLENSSNELHEVSLSYLKKLDNIDCLKEFKDLNLLVYGCNKISHYDLLMFENLTCDSKFLDISRKVLEDFDYNLHSKEDFENRVFSLMIEEERSEEYVKQYPFQIINDKINNYFKSEVGLEKFDL